MAAVCPSCGRENPDEFAFCGHCGAALVPLTAGREVRKTVTVLFADVVGSTALGESRDPEAVRTQMARWFEESRTVLERHGGRVEKFIGDAVMAVFGIPQSHEDDALRAVRAAAELQDGKIRIGVNTGTVVAGEGQTLVTGDAVNVAARLEQAARPGEVLLGTQTHRLVRNAVEAEPVEPLALKGKAEPVLAVRLLWVDPNAEAVARHLDSPLVGRDRELALLGQAFDRAVSERSSQLFTVLGPAGVGKSRLAAEFLSRVNARVVRGRCLPYGEGITYFALDGVLLQLGADPEQITSSSPAETQLAFRKLLEREAADRPLVVVFDDIQWAEPTFLDLIEHIADLSRGAPIFLLCIARPELLDVRPTWGGGKLNASTILLEPLAPAECEQLIASLGGASDEMRAKVVEASQGNPLFVEEMVAMLREEGDVAVPPTIHALLQARLDTLGRDERAVVERGAVEGEVFHRMPVAEMAPEAISGDLDGHLATLIRKELIRPDTAMFRDDDAYRFRHLLVRDAAYESLPKETRAELHEQFADWLEEHAELVEQNEIVGYHLEQAHRYLRELDPDDRGLSALSVRGAERLGAAGEEARDRADYAAAMTLLERAVALLPPGHERRVPLLPDLAEVLAVSGRFADARVYVEEARDSPDRRWRAHGAIAECYVDAWTGSFTSVEEWLSRIGPAKDICRELGDERGLARAIDLESFAYWASCRVGESAAAARTALAHAQRAGSRALVQQLRGLLAAACTHGPTPLHEAEAELKTILEQSRGQRLVEGAVQRGLGRLAAMQGDFERGRELTRLGRGATAEAGLRIEDAANCQAPAFVEWLAGDDEAEERMLREGLELLDQLGDRAFYSTVGLYLAACLHRQGRDDEAMELLPVMRERSSEGDLVNFAESDAVEARIEARRGNLARAERLALRAVDLAETTDFWQLRGNALEALATVHIAAGRPEQAREAFERALRVYDEKGCVVLADSVRALVAEL